MERITDWDGLLASAWFHGLTPLLAAALRPCSDLDILVRPQDMPEVLRILQREKYELEPHLARLPVPALLDWTVEVPLRHARGTHVDLHWAVAPRDYPFNFDAVLVARRIGPSTIWMPSSIRSKLDICRSKCSRPALVIW